MNRVSSCLAIAMLFSGLACARATAQDQTREGTGVTIELVLAADVSISVDAREYQLQMQGIAQALRSEEVINQIGQLPQGVAIALVHWSIAHLNRVAVDWHYLTDRQSILQFARLVESVPRSRTGRSTAIGDAVDFSRRLIEMNAFDGEHMRIDISGDERNNSGPAPSQARNRAVAQGMTVNGLAITGSDKRLYNYYLAYVIGGPGAFVLSVDRFADFQTAMQRKLMRELSVSTLLE